MYMPAKISDWFSVFKAPDYRNGLKEREAAAVERRATCRKEFTDALEELDGDSETLDELKARLETDNQVMREALGG